MASQPRSLSLETPHTGPATAQVRAEPQLRASGDDVEGGDEEKRENGEGEPGVGMQEGQDDELVVDVPAAPRPTLSDDDSTSLSVSIETGASDGPRLDQMTLKELRSQCEAKGLSNKGRKADLLERLLQGEQ